MIDRKAIGRRKIDHVNLRDVSRFARSECIAISFEPVGKPEHISGIERVTLLAFVRLHRSFLADRHPPSTGIIGSGGMPRIATVTVRSWEQAVGNLIAFPSRDEAVFERSRALH